MKRESMQSALDWFREKPGRVTALRIADKCCVGAAVAAFLYSALLSPGLRDPKLTLRFLLTCGIPFVLLSAARHLLDLPRPYEVWDLEPLTERESADRSFPSHHVFSIFVIGTAELFLTPWLGAVLLPLGAVLAVTRVVSGLHFPRDVIAGAALGAASAAVGFLCF